jgi:hypothetical protein
MQDLLKLSYTSREEDRALALSEIKAVVDEYAEIKNFGAPLEIQNLRDRLEIAKNNLGFDLLSNARSDMELAEIARKRAYAEVMLKHSKNIGKGKEFGSQAEAKEQTYLDIMPYIEQEQKANSFFYRVKEIMDNSEKFINSVASRLRLLQNEH